MTEDMAAVAAFIRLIDEDWRAFIEDSAVQSSESAEFRRSLVRAKWAMRRIRRTASPHAAGEEGE